MDFLKKWTISLAATVIFITVVEMILPDNNLKKYSKFVLGLILIAVILNPILTLYSTNLSIDNITNYVMQLIDNNNNSEKADTLQTGDREETINAFKENLQSTIQKDLQSEYPDLSFKVGTVIEYDENSNEIKIKNVSISFNDGAVKAIDKVNVNTKESNVSSAESSGDSKSNAIKNYIKNKYDIAASSISIYKM